MKWQHGIAGRPREPDGPRLRDTRGSARTVERKTGRPPVLHIAHQLQHRLQTAVRGGPARRAEAKALDDARNPLPVEILARDDDDAAAAEVVGGRKDAPVPEGHHGLTAGVDDGVVVMEAFNLPPQRVTERVDDRIAESGDGGDLGPFGPGRTPVVGHVGPYYRRYGSTFTDAVY